MPMDMEEGRVEVMCCVRYDWLVVDTGRMEEPKGNYGCLTTIWRYEHHGYVGLYKGPTPTKNIFSMCDAA